MAFDDLSALFLNCSLEPDRADSHTQRLLNRVAGVMFAEGVDCDLVHLRDHHIPFGMGMDLTEQGEDRDDWPASQERVMAGNTGDTWSEGANAAEQDPERFPAK